MFFIWLFALHLLSISFLATANVLDGQQNVCSCGFFDRDMNELFTDSMIVYFNETIFLEENFITEDYEHKYEKEWNSVFRQGADPVNVRINESHSLELVVSEPTKHHLVNGGDIRTKRRDIQYGSFRTLLKAPQKDAGGSALSMKWQYNDTEACELSVMNTATPSEAWIGTFINNEFTSRSLGVNFTDAINSTSGNRDYTVLEGAHEDGSVDPWGYTEYRIDWTKDAIDFYVGGNLTRSISREKNSRLPSVPASLHFMHWSTGNQYSMDGPPLRESSANVRWVRLFFNSSILPDRDGKSVFKKCAISDACSVADIYLRGSTPYSKKATKKWKQVNVKDIKRMPTLWISVVCLALSSLLICHALIRRAPWRRRPSSGTAAAHSSDGRKISEPDASISNTSFRSNCFQPSVCGSRDFKSDTYSHPGHSSLSSLKQPPPIKTPSWQGSEEEITIAKMEKDCTTPLSVGSSHHDSLRAPISPSFLRSDSQATTLRVLSPYSSDFDTTSENLIDVKARKAKIVAPQENHPSTQPETPQNPSRLIQISAIGENKEFSRTPKEMQTTAVKPLVRPSRDRIDYLAGLVALCAILVTVMHFGLTFAPAIVIPGAPAHYRSEYWAQKIIAPFVLNQMWLGIFFTTSTRFLVSSYLKNGNLKDIAKGTVRRCPRLMVPVTAVALLEYFLIDCGVTKYLRYIPSLTWSTWPYVTRFPTIGHFISEILELIYLIPNAIPQITYNFCTGVLWTLAVQLQGSWLVLTGVIVIYEIKTAWKRFTYYTVCITSHWYAESWGSYLWFGLLLADLDITYRYKPWLYSRGRVYYPLMIFCWICVALGFAANIIPNWTDYNIIAYEHNIHPDHGTGLPIWKTPNAGYPAYYIPRFNGLLFAAGMQAIVELSTTVQAILSFRAFLFLFPHIFTIYLLHGLVFWSWGSWLLIVLVDRNFSYGVSLVTVGLTSYFIIFLILPIATPVIESLGKDITALVWMNATEKSPPKRRTLFPFPEDLFEKRKVEGDVEASAGVGSNGSSAGGNGNGNGNSNALGKGKGKAKVAMGEIRM